MREGVFVMVLFWMASINCCRELVLGEEVLAK